jgi:hypothetical protein
MAVMGCVQFGQFMYMPIIIQPGHVEIPIELLSSNGEEALPPG